MQQAVDWHDIEAAEALQRLESSAYGLGSAAARQRLAEHGPNIIEEKQRRPLARIVLSLTKRVRVD